LRSCCLSHTPVALLPFVAACLLHSCCLSHILIALLLYLAACLLRPDSPTAFSAPAFNSQVAKAKAEGRGNRAGRKPLKPGDSGDRCGCIRDAALREEASARRGSYWAALEANYSPADRREVRWGRSMA
jgi:hypothetical protein